MVLTRLTEYSHGAGCACKLSSAELGQILGPVRGHAAADHPDLMVGLATSDDAGGSVDSRLEYTPRRDGVYYLSLIDAYDQGGPAHAYRLRARVVPDKR